MLETLTDRWRKLAAEIRADFGAELQRTTERGFRLYLRQKEHDIIIPDDVVGWRSTTLSDGNDRGWSADEETPSLTRDGSAAAAIAKALPRSRGRGELGTLRVEMINASTLNQLPHTSDVNKRRIAALGTGVRIWIAAQ
jgi:hypothetical protein